MRTLRKSTAVFATAALAVGSLSAGFSPHSSQAALNNQSSSVVKQTQSLDPNHPTVADVPITISVLPKDERPAPVLEAYDNSFYALETGVPDTYYSDGRPVSDVLRVNNPGFLWSRGDFVEKSGELARFRWSNAGRTMRDEPVDFVLTQTYTKITNNLVSQFATDGIEYKSDAGFIASVYLNTEHGDVHTTSGFYWKNRNAASMPRFVELDASSAWEIKAVYAGTNNEVAGGRYALQFDDIDQPSTTTTHTAEGTYQSDKVERVAFMDGFRDDSYYVQNNTNLRTAGQAPQLVAYATKNNIAIGQQQSDSPDLIDPSPDDPYSESIMGVTSNSTAHFRTGGDGTISTIIGPNLATTQYLDITSTKKVSSAEVGPGEELSWTIDATFPTTTRFNKPREIVVKDTLHDAIQADTITVKVLNIDDDDVSSDFTQSIVDRTVTVTPKILDDVDGKTFKFVVSGRTVDGAAVKKMLASGKYETTNEDCVVISNKGMFSVVDANGNPKTQYTNTVNTDECVAHGDWKPSISKKVDKTAVKPGAAITWDVEMKFPEHASGDAPKSVTMTDSIPANVDPSSVKASDVKVFNAKNNADVTSAWNVDVSGGKVTLSVKAINDSNVNNETYVARFTGKAKGQSDIEAAMKSAAAADKCEDSTVWGSSTPGILVKNKATLSGKSGSGKDVTVTSNQVETCVPPVKEEFDPTLTKTLSKSSEVPGGAAVWELTAVFPKFSAGHEPKSVIVTDTLPDLSVESTAKVKVLDSAGKDVTDQWNVARDGKKLTMTPKTVSVATLSDKTYKFQITVNAAGMKVINSWFEKNTDRCYTTGGVEREGVLISNKAELTGKAYDGKSFYAPGNAEDCVPPTDVPPTIPPVSKIVDKAVVDSGWMVKYDVTQKIEPAKQVYSTDEYYTSVKLVDTLPSQVAYAGDAVLMVDGKQLDSSFYTVSEKNGVVTAALTKAGLDQLNKAGKTVEYHMLLSGTVSGKMDEVATNKVDSFVNKSKSSDTAETVIVDVKLDKSIDYKGQEIKPGAKVKFTVTVKNPSKNTAPNVHVFDDMGAFLTGATFSNPSQGEVDGAVWNVGSLKSGATATATVTATVSKDYVVGQDEIRNRAHVTIGTSKNPTEEEKQTPAKCQVNANVDKDTDRCDEVVGRDNADLKVDKTIKTSNQSFAAGQTIKWTVTAKNAGEGSAQYVTVKDLGGDQVENIKLSNPSAGSVDGVTWNVGTMTAGQTETVTVTGTLVKDYDPAKPLKNTVLIKNPLHPKDDPKSDDECVVNKDVDSDEDQCDSTVTKEASDLKVLKTIRASKWYAAGQQVTWDITVKNAGTDTAANVKLRDYAKSNIENLVFGEPSQGSVKDLVWSVGTLKPGETATITVTGTIPAGYKAGSAIDNQAIVENPFHLFNPENPSQPEAKLADGKRNTTIDADDDQYDRDPAKENSVLQVDKAIVNEKGTWFAPGQTVTFKVTAKNAGKDTAKQVVVRDYKGKALTAIQFSNPSQGEVDGAVWNVGDLAAGATATATVTGVLTDDFVAGSLVDNDVIIENPFHPFNPDDPDNPSKARTGKKTNKTVDEDDDQFDKEKVQEASVLKIDKSYVNESKIRVAPGQKVTYTITAKNAGEATARWVEVRDYPGAHVKSVKLSNPSQGEIDENGIWQVGSLKAGQEVTATATVVVDDGYVPGESLVNHAIVQNPHHPFNPESPNEPEKGLSGKKANTDVDSDDDQYDRVSGSDKSELKVDKEFADKGATVLKAGSTIDYVVTAKNASETATARFVTVTDLGGPRLSKITSTEPSQGSVMKDGSTWNVGTLKAGQAETLKVSGVLAEDYVAAEMVENTVVIETPYQPINPNDPKSHDPVDCVPNEGVDADTDRCDVPGIVEKSVLQVDKKLREEVTEAGQQVTWDITVKNNGETGAADVDVTDVPGVGLVEGSAVISEPSKGEIDAETGVWHVGDMVAGEVQTAVVTATTTDTLTEGVVNGVKVENPVNPKVLDKPEDATPNPTVEEDTDQADVEIYREDSVLQVDKQLNDAETARFAAGEKITFTVTAMNAGEDTAKQVVVTDLGGPGLSDITFVDVEAGSVDETAAATWLVGDLEPGVKVTAVVEATIAEDYVPVDGSSNTVVIKNPTHPREDIPAEECVANPEGVESDEDQCDTIPLREKSELKIVKTADVTGVVRPGTEVTYTIEVGNFGEGVAADVVVKDIPGVGAATLFAPAKGEVAGATWNVGDLAAGETARVSAKVTIPSDFKGEFINKADVENPANPHDPNAYEENPTLEADTDQGDQAPLTVEPAPVSGKSFGRSTLSRTGAPAGVGIVVMFSLLGAGVGALSARRKAA